MNFADVLNHFKESESAESIMPLVDSDALRNGVVAWKGVVIRFTKCGECPVTLSESEKWEWLWSCIEFDKTAFGVVAGARPQDTGILFTRLKGLRLIYPDGAINDYAAKYMQALIMAKLPKSR